MSCELGVLYDPALLCLPYYNCLDWHLTHLSSVKEVEAYRDDEAVRQ
jgi:hypothetical protein